MARSVNEKEYALKRNQILDVTQRLVYTKGYEQMAIQDILGELQISKGAFYHYFDSKPALLEALVERMGQEALDLIRPIVEDPNLPALEKLQRFKDLQAAAPVHTFTAPEPSTKAPAAASSSSSAPPAEADVDDHAFLGARCVCG